MKKLKYILLPLSLLTFILFATRCVETFSPDIDKYERLLVVDGFVSNEKTSYKVTLSRSMKYNDVYPAKVSGALVKIIADDGNEVVLNESRSSEGLYTTKAGEFVGEIGKQYKLYIKVDNKEYSSDFELMQNVPDIDTLYYDFTDSEVINEAGHVMIKRGLRMYVDVKNTEGCADYLFWAYDETWKFQVPYSIPSTLDKKYCYKTNASKEFLFESLAKHKGRKLEKQELYIIDNTTNRLRLRYTTNVKQYGINETAYQFYRRQKDQQENVGSLFDKTPISIVGNVKCLTNPEEPVLGLFRVAAEKETRIFIDYNDIKKYMDCSIDVDCEVEMIPNIDPETGASNANYIRQLVAKDNLVIMDTISVMNVSYTRIASTRMCFDCTAGGAPNTPPSYWVEAENN